METDGRKADMDFWGHLDALRSVLLRCVAFVLLLAAVLFSQMTWIFDYVILAPCRPGFPLYDLLGRVEGLSMFMPSGIDAQLSDIPLINIHLASQFFIHISTSFWLAIVLAFPFLLQQVWGFISPGLYDGERRGAGRALLGGTAMFYAGIFVGYFLVFPLTLRFLAEYQVSASVPNQIALDSYMDNFLALVLIMGIVFELPVVAWMLGRCGLLTRNIFSRYRRHAIVALLALAAVVTPTGDPFTLMVVFLPVYMLWELSAFLVPDRQISTDSRTIVTGS